ncbi:hypothetical protein HDV00_012782 [Rhizophlyctis rosea]|nr:hypothetical protein HDV00_012782 [Rhizophlyctis rosea]
MSAQGSSLQSKLVTRDDIEDILNRLGNIGDGGQRLTIRDLEPYQRAFVHRRYLGDPDPRLRFVSKKSNEFERFTVLGSKKGRNNPRLYEDCFKAFVGAIIVDFGDEKGYKYARRFLVAIIEHLVDFADIIMQNKNHKHTLQRFFQSQKFPTLVYIDLWEAGPSHLREYYNGVFLKRSQLSTLEDTVMQEAESYHQHVLNNCAEPVAVAIRKYADVEDAVLIGMGKANKKSEAEQQCSSTGLCVLGVSSNW